MFVHGFVLKCWPVKNALAYCVRSLMTKKKWAYKAWCLVVVSVAFSADTATASAELSSIHLDTLKHKKLGFIIY